MPLAAAGGQALLDRRARPLQCRFDGCLAGVEHLRHFGCAKAEHVAEHERGPLAGWQVLQRGHECETDCLSRLVAGLRSGSSVREPLEQDVGVGLEPGRFDRAGRLGGLGIAGTSRGRRSRSRSTLRQRLVAIR